MKKILISIIVLIASITATHAQKGSSIVNAQVGVAGSWQGFSLSVGGYASYEYFATDYLSIGALVGVVGIESPEFVSSFRQAPPEFPSSVIAAGALANYHFLTSEKLDLYIGTSLGYASEYIGKFLYEFHGGARYYISDAIALNAELGFGLSVLKAGVSFKL